MAEWLGVAAATITKYFRGETNAVLRKRKMLAMLNDRGLIATNMSGKNVEWRVRYLQNQLRGFDDSTTLTFSRVNRHQVAALDWRGYEMAEGITDRETEMNKGAEAIVKLMSQKAKWMMEDCKQQLGTEIYVDGNATGNGTRFHGLESFGAYNSTLAGAPVGVPDDSYAGLATDLGDKGGSWSDTTKWPSGEGSSQYDYWSPLIVDYTSQLATASGGWAAATKTWANTAIEALSYGLLHGRKNDDVDKQVDVVFLDRELYRGLTNLLRLNERLNITPSEGSSGLWKLGFKDIVNFDGVDVTWEFGTPANVGYGIATNEIELMSLKSELVNAKGPTFDEASQSYRFWLIVLANLKFESIRNMIFWKAIGGS